MIRLLILNLDSCSAVVEMEKLLSLISSLSRLSHVFLVLRERASQARHHGACTP